MHRAPKSHRLEGFYQFSYKGQSFAIFFSSLHILPKIYLSLFLHKKALKRIVKKNYCPIYNKNKRKKEYGYIKYANMLLTRMRPHSYSKRHSDTMFCPHCNKKKWKFKTFYHLLSSFYCYEMATVCRDWARIYCLF